MTQSSSRANTQMVKSNTEHFNFILKSISDMYLFKNEGSPIYKEAWGFLRSIRIRILIDDIFPDISRSTKIKIFMNDVHQFCRILKENFG